MPETRKIPQFIAGVSQCFIDTYIKRFGQPNAPAHDVVAVMYVSHPDVFTKARTRVEVELKGELTRGMSVADWKGKWNREPNCDVLLTVDAAGFLSAFANSIATLP